jgi:hypothetical protein
MLFCRAPRRPTISGRLPSQSPRRRQTSFNLKPQLSQTGPSKKRNTILNPGNIMSELSQRQVASSQTRQKRATVNMNAPLHIPRRRRSVVDESDAEEMRRQLIAHRNRQSLIVNLGSSTPRSRPKIGLKRRQLKWCK